MSAMDMLESISLPAFRQSALYLLLLPLLYYSYVLLIRRHIDEGIPKAENERGWTSIFQSKFWVESRRRSVNSAYIKA
ncbi:hypothetical protein E4U52_000692, partial [Claviceps spartinae]